MRVLALDFEGTNKEPRRGAPIQLGLAIMDSGTVVAQAETLIRPPTHYKSGKPTKEVDAYSLRVSGLTLEKVESEGLGSTTACKWLQSFVKKHDAKEMPIVAYSMSYDIECYRQLLYDGGTYDWDLREYFGFPEIICGPWHCAFSMARMRLSGKLLNFSLDDVAGFFGLSREGEAHGAGEDCILAGQIFHRLSETAKGQAA